MRIREPYSITRQFKVRLMDDGRRLVDYLAERFPFHSPEEWQSRIQNGDVLLDGASSHPGHVIRPFQTITHHSHHVVEPAVPDAVAVVQETEGWLIVDKPAPLPVHSGGRYHHNTLLEILRDRGWEDLRPVHRLDAVTRGLICLAKGAVMADRLSKAFQQESSKGYLALVANVKGLPEGDHLVDLPIRRKKGFVFESASHPQDRADGFKHALTSVRLHALEKGIGDPAWLRETPSEEVVSPYALHLAQCIPITGRTHQIRLHLRALGLPIVDDPIYGPGGDDSGETLQNRSICLQSSYLEVPTFDIRVELPVPREWKLSDSDDRKRVNDTQEDRYERTMVWNSPGLSRKA